MGEKKENISELTERIQMIREDLSKIFETLYVAPSYLCETKAKQQYAAGIRSKQLQLCYEIFSPGENVLLSSQNTSGTKV
jgi:hypothetical protein